MPEVEFVGPSAQNAEHIQANTCRLVNCYREPTGQGGRTGHILRQVPATTLFKSLGAVFIRDMQAIGDTLYVLNGANLRSLTPSGTLTTLGEIASANGGHIFGETGAVGVVSGGSYYVWNGTTLSQPAVTPFTPTTGNVGSGAYLNGYTVLTEKDGRTFAWSDILDATTFPGTNIATIEGTEDPILRVIAINGKLWFLKSNSLEIWYLTGSSGANAFARIPGGTMNTGLKGADLVTVLRDAMVFVGSDGVVYMSDGQGNRPISTPAVERNVAVEQLDRCFVYEQDGHKFFGIRYRDRPADIFDLSTAEWHERASGALQEAWDVRASAYFNGMWRAGSNSGEIYTLARGSTDANGPLISEATSTTLKIDNNRFRIAELEIFADMAPDDQSALPQPVNVTVWIIDGVPDFVIDGSEIIDGDDVFNTIPNEDRQPKIEVAISGDYGRTWTPYRTRKMGRPGEYDSRALWRNLGQFRQATVKVRVSDDVSRAINTRATIKVF